MNITKPRSQRKRRKTSAVSSSWDRLLRLIPGHDPFATAAPGDWFDAEAAQRVIDFFAECLTHVKGKLAGKPLALEPWQQSVVSNLFGWRRADGTRRYREAFILVPRKNGKTTLCAGLGNFMLFCDGEPGAEIYCAASEREQAALLFEVAKQQVLREPVLSGSAKIYQRSIVLEENASSFKVISAEAKSKHGFNSHCVINDELHAQPDRELIDVLMTSTGARRQPLVIHITTSDYDRESICNEKYEYACRVRDGEFADPSFLPVIYEALPTDDWKDPAVWRKANPCLGVSLSEDYIRRECLRAQETPTYENTFKRLHLNIKTEQDVRWLPMDHWDACRGLVNAEELKGNECWGGLDLSSTTDISALALLFRRDEGWAVLPFFWLPGDQIEAREKRDAMPYATWARQGLITLTEGNRIDYEVIRAKILELGGIYSIREIAFDPWNSTQLVNELQGDGVSMIEFRQGFASYTAPAKELEAQVLAGTLAHGGNPILRRMASKVSAEIDAAGNIKPSKKKSKERIDGIVATVMALGRAMVGGGSGCVYEHRRLFVT